MLRLALAVVIVDGPHAHGDPAVRAGVEDLVEM